MKLRYPALLALACTPFAQANDIFISEYVEGSGVNKALEFFNPTDVAVDLTAGNYQISLFSNGASSASSTVSLEGIIQPNGTFVIVNSNNDVSDTLEDLADQESGTINHNGDDAYVLYKDGVVIDSFGDVGFDPGSRWEENGVDTQDQTLRRISTVSAGDTQIDDDFDPSAEWTEHARDDFSDIGRHTFNDGEVEDVPPTVQSISPADGAQFVGVDANIDISFSEEVSVSAWSDVICTISGNHVVSGDLNGTSFILDPATDFILDESCSFTVLAANVSDVDGTADNLADDVTTTFSVGAFPLVINEIHADPATGLDGDANGDGTRDSSQDEFVELVNASGSELDISGWTVSDAVGLRHTFPANTLLAADCAVVVFGGSTPVGEFGGALVQTASEGSVGFNNGGDTVSVSSGAATISTVYGSEGGDNQSITLNPDVTGTEYAKHSEVEQAGGTLYSPGTRVDGTLFEGCEVPDLAPFVAETSPANNATEVSATNPILVTFSEAVEVFGFADLVCSVSGNVVLNETQDGLTYSLQPEVTLAAGESCSLTIGADSVVDQDGESDSMLEDFVLSFTTTNDLLACDSEFTLISAIQGSGSTTPFNGQTVQFQAVVTRLAPDLSGFYIQEEASDFDADPSTSEGVFVRNTDSIFAYPAVNELVAVKGEVSEFSDRTQVTMSEALVSCGEAAELPVAQALTLPLPAEHDFEALEGMLVSVSQDLIVTNTFELGRRSEFELSSQLKFNPTNQFTPGSAERIALAEQNSRDRILIDDASFFQNRDNVIYPTGGLSASNTLRLGDQVSGVTGVVDYDGFNRFPTYQIMPTVDLTFTSLNLREDTPELEEGNLKVASFNVLNFFNGDGQGGGFPTPRGAPNADDFERQADKIISALVTMDADIVGLVEIENDGFGAESAIQELVDRLNAEVGEGTYTILDPGVSQIGTDEIMVGFIYKPAKVGLVGDAKILDSSNSISDESGVLFLDTRNRPALAQEFSLIENDESLVITINHLKSKGSNCNSLGDPDIGDGQANCNITRTRAATALAAWLETEFADKPTLVMGDLNAYAKEDPIMALSDAGFTNLIAEFEGEEAYSFSFRGEVGYLDHAMANAELLENVVDATEWAINADEPVALDYTTRFKSDFNDINYYAPDAFRSSDHDPVLVSFNLLPAGPVLGDFDGDGDVDRADMQGIIISLLRGQPVDLSFDLNGDGIVTTRDVRLLADLCTRFRCAL